MLEINEHTSLFLKQAALICDIINPDEVSNLAQALNTLRANAGRLFFIGVGGSAANCSHAVNDFRKLCGIECYSATENVAELTARINDEGWEGALAEWLKVSKLSSKDGIFVMSVGGGNKEKNVSVNIIKAVDFARASKAKVLGIVGRDGGYTRANGDVTVLIPTTSDELVTPLAESFQSIVWHCLVSNPLLQINPTKW